METITSPEIQNLPPITPQNNNYKILFFIFLALFLIISTVLITLLITQKSLVPTQTTNTQETKSITSVPTESVVTPTVVTTPIESAITSSIPKDWKTYVDATYKYSIQYPSDWILNKTSNELVFLLTKERDQYLKSGKIGPLSDLSIKVYKNISLLENNDKSLGLYDWLKQEESKNLIYNIKSLNYWSTPAYQVTSRGESDSEGIYIQKNNFIYSISVASEKISEFNQSIINTFKFN